MNWDHEKILNLISEYEKRPILWRKDHPFYFNVVRKEDAWREISDIFIEEVDVLKKKMDSVRGSRRREKNRILKSMGTGKGRKDIYVSKWFAWESLQFLEDPDEIKPTTSNVNTPEFKAGDGNEDNRNAEQKKDDDCSIRGSDEDLVEDSDTTNSATKIPKKRFISPKKPAPKRRASEDPRIQEAFEILKNRSEAVEKKDDCSIFGNFIAEKMRKLDNRTRAILQHQIHNLIFQAEMEPHTSQMQSHMERPLEYYCSPSHSPSRHYFTPSPASSYTSSPLPSPQDPLHNQQQEEGNCNFNHSSFKPL